MTEIGEEAAPAAVPAAASPLKPIVLKLTSNKPPAQEEQATTADSAEDPLKTADNAVQSADEPVKSADEPVKTTDTMEETEAADESSEASGKPAMVLNPIAVAAAKKAESTDAMDAEEKLFYEAVKDPSEEEPAKEAEEKQTTEKDVPMEEEVDPMDAIADPDELGWCVKKMRA